MTLTDKIETTFLKQGWEEMLGVVAECVREAEQAGYARGVADATRAVQNCTRLLGLEATIDQCAADVANLFAGEVKK